MTTNALFKRESLGHDVNLRGTLFEREISRPRESFVGKPGATRGVRRSGAARERNAEAEILATIWFRRYESVEFDRAGKSERAQEFAAGSKLLARPTRWNLIAIVRNRGKQCGIERVAFVGDFNERAKVAAAFAIARNVHRS